MQTLRKLFELSVREFWLLVQSAILVRVVHCALKFVTVARLQRLGAQTVTEFRRAGQTGPGPEAIARLVRIAAERGPFGAECLEQSLVLRWLLQRRGIDAQILFGARKEDEQMQAHAWVEVDGVTVSEDNGVYREFSPFKEAVSKG